METWIHLSIIKTLIVKINAIHQVICFDIIGLMLLGCLIYILKTQHSFSAHANYENWACTSLLTSSVSKWRRLDLILSVYC